MKMKKDQKSKSYKSSNNQNSSGSSCNGENSGGGHNSDDESDSANESEESDNEEAARNAKSHARCGHHGAMHSHSHGISVSANNQLAGKCGHHSSFGLQTMRSNTVNNNPPKLNMASTQSLPSSSSSSSSSTPNSSTTINNSSPISGISNQYQNIAYYNSPINQLENGSKSNPLSYLTTHFDAKSYPFYSSPNNQQQTQAHSFSYNSYTNGTAQTPAIDSNSYNLHAIASNPTNELYAQFNQYGNSYSTSQTLNGQFTIGNSMNSTNANRLLTDSLGNKNHLLSNGSSSYNTTTTTTTNNSTNNEINTNNLSYSTLSYPTYEYNSTTNGTFHLPAGITSNLDSTSAAFNHILANN